MEGQKKLIIRKTPVLGFITAFNGLHLAPTLPLGFSDVLGYRLIISTCLKLLLPR